MKQNKFQDTTIAINEAQLLLAEKRTSLSAMRTGIAVLALPISVLSVLIATSKYYDIEKVIHLLVPLGVLVCLLLILGGYLIIRATIRIRRYDRLIMEIKRKHSIVAELVD